MFLDFGGLNQKSAIISICEIHIYIDSKSFRQIHGKCRRSRLFGDWHSGKMGFWDMAIFVVFWRPKWSIWVQLTSNLVCSLISMEIKGKTSLKFISQKNMARIANFQPKIGQGATFAPTLIGHNSAIFIRFWRSTTPKWLAQRDKSNAFKGAGGSPSWGWSKSSFMLYLLEGDPSYQILFTGSKNFVPSRSYRILKSWNTGNYSMHADFNRDLRKMTILEFQNLSSPTFFIQSSWNLI